MARDPAVLAHQEWLGYVQPVGLVVSIPALLEANARINQNYAPERRRFLDALPANADGEPIPEITDFPAFVQEALGWTLGDQLLRVLLPLQFQSTDQGCRTAQLLKRF